MNNPCETELYSRSAVFENISNEKFEETVRKIHEDYEKRLSELENVLECKMREIEELKENNNSLVKENMKLRGYIPRKTKGNSIKNKENMAISQENKDKMLKNLLFKIKWPQKKKKKFYKIFLFYLK